MRKSNKKWAEAFRKRFPILLVKKNWNRWKIKKIINIYNIFTLPEIRLGKLVINFGEYRHRQDLAQSHQVFHGQKMAIISHNIPESWFYWDPIKRIGLSLRGRIPQIWGIQDPISSEILNRYSTPLSKLRRISIEVKRSLSFDLAYLEVSNRMAKHQTTPIVSAIKFFG